MKNKSLVLVVVLIIFLVLTSLFVFGAKKILDPDSFYHIRHAWLYRTGGLFNSEFPWLQFSVIRLYAADIWYGFHVFLIPFTFFSDLTIGIKFSAVVFATLTLLLFYWVFKRHQIAYPLFWVLLLYFSATDFLFRMNMSRPQTLTLGLLVLLFSLLIKPGRIWATFMLSFLIAFIHLNFFWAALLIGFLVSIFTFIFEKKIDWRNLLAIPAGLIVGWFLRPNPIGALKILWVQLFELIAEKQKDLPLLFGEELYPLNWAGIKFKLVPLLILWISALLFFGWLLKRKKLVTASNQTKIFIWCALGLALIFFILAFWLSQRALDLTATFAVLFISQLISWWSNYQKQKNKKLSGFLTAGLVIVFLIMIGRHTYTFNSYIKALYIPSTEEFKEVSLWLNQNSEPEEIVFHVSWDMFPMLFFWNQKNYYINGMDPIFEYALSHELYLKNVMMALSGLDFACGTLPCNRETGEPLHKVISEDFRASYAVVEKDRSPRLNQNLQNDPGFLKVLETEGEVVYKVKK